MRRVLVSGFAIVCVAVICIALGAKAFPSSVFAKFGVSSYESSPLVVCVYICVFAVFFDHVLSTTMSLFIIHCRSLESLLLFPLPL
jgi:hypothetical protein